MSKSGNVLNGLIEKKLLNLHTAFFANVLNVSTSDNIKTAKVQPLNMIKASGQTAQKQAVMTIPVLKDVDISAGDTAFCLCSERDITNTKKGKFVVPPVGHHRISDAVVIGVI